jgi:hypothetical protein
MLHPRDEDLESREVHVPLEIDPQWAWYYRIFSNFRTLVILLQIDPTYGDEPEIVYEGCYKIIHLYLRMVFNS